MKKQNILNMGQNQIIGNVVFGQGCIINPTCSIICEKKDQNFKIVFGDFNIIEERAVIMFKPTSEKDNVMRIGNFNVFGIKSFVGNSQVGDGNVIEARAQIKDAIIGNFNIIGSDTRINKKNIKNKYRIFYPGIIKQIDIIDEERIKETIKQLFIATKATLVSKKTS